MTVPDVLVFGPDHRDGRQFTRMSEGVLVYPITISQAYIVVLRVITPWSLISRCHFGGIHCFCLQSKSEWGLESGRLYKSMGKGNESWVIGECGPFLV
jgi:hypothetical protein